MMKKYLFPLALLLAACSSERQEQCLFYDKPASAFEEALPIGNGSIGAMVYGEPVHQHFSLNDITLWSGEPDKGAGHPDLIATGLNGSGEQALQAVREALQREDYATADTLQRRLQGHYSETYLPLGTLRMDLDSCAVSGYSRRLDLDDATVTVEFLRDSAVFRETVFASAPDSVIVIRLQSEKPLNLSLALESQLPNAIHSEDAYIKMDGYAPYHAYPVYFEYKELSPSRELYDASRGIHFRTGLQVDAPGANVISEDGVLKIEGLSEATIYLVNSTSFNGPFKDPVKEGLPYASLADANLENAAKLGYRKLESRHQADYKALFGRFSLDLGATPDSVRCLPTDVQLLRYTKLEETNPDLEELYVQYGRYLLISSSRTHGVPANLQGLWNEKMAPPWSCNYTVNINLEENYWPALSAALPEMHAPLREFLHALAINGGPAASRMYGISEGWMAGHNSDIWAMATPVGLGDGDPSWANWNMGGAWLSANLWENYLFTRDMEALKADYPVLKGSAEFCLSWLTSSNGELISTPGTSPENIFVTPSGYIGETAYGTTADHAIIRECLMDAIAAARELSVDEEFVLRAEDALSRIHHYEIGADGRLQEWYHDWKDFDIRHRHQSHLIGVYPGHQIADGPLADAAHKTLETRGFETTGWSCGWRVNLYARLGDGESAYRMYRTLLRYVSPGAKRGGGTYPNLLDAHPPFQIDGNYGGTAGVLEMLMGSMPDGSLEPLRALPAAWPSGSVRGLRTRRGTTVDMVWQDGKVISMKER